jgi:hypothetical protein
MNICMQCFFLLLVSNTIPRMMDPPLAIWRLQPPLHKLLLLLLQCWWQLLLIITDLLVFRFFVLYIELVWLNSSDSVSFSWESWFWILHTYIKPSWMKHSLHYVTNTYARGFRITSCENGKKNVCFLSQISSFFCNCNPPVDHNMNPVPWHQKEFRRKPEFEAEENTV